jgi:tol-pal system protein YbgF
VGLGTRVDQVSGDVRTLQQAVSDLTSSMSKMNAQLNDISTAIKALSIPATPPPPQAQPGGTGGGLGASSMPPMNQKDMFDAAKGDYTTGKVEIAAQEFQDFLRYYGNSDLAPSAQYYVALIYYSSKNYAAAAKEFDTVIEKYPEDARTKDAKLYKGLSLIALSNSKDAIPILKDLVTRYPGSDQAVRACTELKAIGINCPKPAAPATHNTTARKKADL